MIEAILVVGGGVCLIALGFVTGKDWGRRTEAAEWRARADQNPILSGDDFYRLLTVGAYTRLSRDAAIGCAAREAEQAKEAARKANAPTPIGAAKSKPKAVRKVRGKA